MSLSAGRGPAGARGEQGTLSGLSSQALLKGKGSGGQPGRHSQSISSKQGKLIPGPRMLLLGANTTAAGTRHCCSERPEPSTAVQRSTQAGRQAGAGVQAELLCCP